MLVVTEKVNIVASRPYWKLVRKVQSVASRACWQCQEVKSRTSRPCWKLLKKNEGSIKTVLKIPGESSERSTKSMLEVTEKMLVYSTPSGNVAEDTFVSDLFHRSEAKAQ
jgi:hypothetical protein